MRALRLGFVVASLIEIQAGSTFLTEILSRDQTGRVRNGDVPVRIWRAPWAFPFFRACEPEKAQAEVRVYVPQNNELGNVMKALDSPKSGGCS
jgi:hypothetical protein